MSNGNEMYVDYLKPKTPTWKRPEGPPRVWRVVDGRKKMENGRIPRFSIQEIPKESEDEVTEFMLQNFIREEPTCQNQGLADDPLGVREFRTIWKGLVRQGVSLVAFEVNPDDPTAKPVIAGANVLHVVTAEDEAGAEDVTELRSKLVKKIFGVVTKLGDEAHVLEKYGVDKYLDALGLSVDTAFRGQGLGEEILRARDDIGLAYRIPACKTVFTAMASQILASRVGYEVILEEKYSEILDDEGKLAFPGINVEFMKVMSKRIY